VGRTKIATNFTKELLRLIYRDNHEKVLEGTEPNCYIKGGWSQAANKGEWAW
jgi:hypothetical protein